MDASSSTWRVLNLKRNVPFTGSEISSLNVAVDPDTCNEREASSTMEKGELENYAAAKHAAKKTGKHSR